MKEIETVYCQATVPLQLHKHDAWHVTCSLFELSRNGPLICDNPDIKDFEGRHLKNYFEPLHCVTLVMKHFSHFLVTQVSRAPWISRASGMNGYDFQKSSFYSTGQRRARYSRQIPRQCTFWGEVCWRRNHNYQLLWGSWVRWVCDEQRATVWGM